MTRILRPEPGREFLYRVVYSKLGKARFFGQLEIAAALGRAIRRAGLPAAFSKGYNPHPKISFDEALPLGMETIVAEAYVSMSENIDPALLRERLNLQCDGVIRIGGVARLDKKPASGIPTRGVYLASQLDTSLVRSLLDARPRCVDNLLTKKTKKGQISASLGQILLDMRSAGANSLEMDIYETPALCFRPMAILESLAGAQARGLENCLICKIGKVALGD
jgi:radical SAM-linked protein